MQTRTLTDLRTLAAPDWNALVRDQNPFLRHEFLNALEQHGCLGRRTGWYPQHIVCLEDGRLIGAMPLYRKETYFGEYVFDHAWEAAYERHGLAYYPKLVSAIPFTPATGQRLLAAPGRTAEVAEAVLHHAWEQAEQHAYSSLHCLFPEQVDLDALLAHGMMQRTGCQFHWHNRGYHDFSDFLDTLTSKKRKNIKRERRLVTEANIALRIVHGHQASAEEWAAFYRFYCATFQYRWGFPYLTQSFFQAIGNALGEQVVLILANDGRQDVAGALCLKSADTLYGRYWGCSMEFDSLHFETCYYQGIDYCIRNGLRRFEPGAQGEHKISRGFLPTLTYSAHWLLHPGFNAAIADFLDRETPAVEAYARSLQQHSPYREATTNA